MIVQVRNRCDDFDSYRAARVKSLFNVQSGANFSHDADLPLDAFAWKLGVVVGPSGSGKTSIGRALFGGGKLYDMDAGWPGDAPIIDAILPAGDFDAVAAALSQVGLGSVPAWLRPYRVLSNGEKFRAALARLVCEAPAEIVVDEFSSVVDRQIARFGALAFQKAWRRTSGRAVLLSCHYDILEWLEPDWVYDTASGRFARDCLRRPRFDLEIWQTDWRYWKLFEPHHYLKIPRMPCAKCYVGTVEGELVCHVAMNTAHTGLGVEARACRLVVMPEWQGAGVGLRFLNELCARYLRGEGHVPRPLTTLFHTSHPGLCAALRRSKGWRQVSCRLHGENKLRSAASLARSGTKMVGACGYGGHLRAAQGFRFYGERAT
jgi:ABC-type transport system involved in cytochrome c biogenesis ATPase subunit/GNAT superfamily N-acetyltransferase